MQLPTALRRWRIAQVATIGVDDRPTHNRVMATTDDEFDATREGFERDRRAEKARAPKRHTARSSEEFHDLAAKVDDAARHVFDTAGAELIEAEEDSPVPDERDEQHPGDWTEGSRN